MHDRFKKRYQSPQATPRLRRQIAVEAARRLFDAITPSPVEGGPPTRQATEAQCYAAKRKAAAVLGHKVRPGDLPSDDEVLEQLALLEGSSPEGDPATDGAEDLEDVPEVIAMADHLDRFAIYKMRLEPLEAVKQDPKRHPEGDALYHSLQVFELAREARPYDEEFLLAALLHDVGKAIDPQYRISAAVESLRGSVTERTLWLIEHQADLLDRRERPPGMKNRRPPETPEALDDLKLLRDLDERGRVPGAPVGTVEEVLDYLRGLENEEYLED